MRSIENLLENLVPDRDQRDGGQLIIHGKDKDNNNNTMRNITER